jgi:hypothetical protein
MSGIFNTLLHGQPEDVLAILDGERLRVIDLKAALTNAFKRIHRLEDQMQTVEIIRKADICISEEGPSEADDRETCAERAAFVAGYCKCYGEHKDPDWDEYGDMITAEAAGHYKQWRADE